MKMWPHSTQADFGKLGNNVVTLHCMCLKKNLNDGSKTFPWRALTTLPDDLF